MGRYDRPPRNPVERPRLPNRILPSESRHDISGAEAAVSNQHRSFPKSEGARSNDADIRYADRLGEPYETNLKHVDGKDISPDVLRQIYEQSGEPLPPELEEKPKQE